MTTPRRRRTSRTHRVRPFWAALAVMLFLATSVTAGTVGRNDEAIVLTGADLPTLQGVNPGDIVAFQFNGSWQQVPVQVDERVTVDFGQIYNDDPVGASALVYTDTDTYTGADTNATFDADDELALRVSDVESQAGSGNPAGVNGSTRVQLQIQNPLNGSTGYLYLFVRSGSLDPAAGASPINYNFNLTSGDYKSTYSIPFGPNAETSSVTTSAYSVGFSDRWIRDVTRISAGSATNVDILERNKAQFAPGDCGRSEQTFSDGQGVFIANIRGPVRSIRSVMGANSGPFTVRTHWFYPEREIARTDLRVHRISGVMDYMDYNASASGMTYYNDLNTSGVTIDGSPDSVATGRLQWEMVTGNQGTMGVVWQLETDLADNSYDSYYSDNTSTTNLCSFWDNVEYGASGLFRTASIPTTNPLSDGHNVYASTRHMKYGAPGQTIAFAQEMLQEQQNPLTVDVSTGGGGGSTCPDGDNDGYAVCDGSCTPAAGDQCGDCNDGNNGINPGATDGCDGVDNDCNAATVDGSAETWFGQVCDGADSDLCTEGTFTCTSGAQQCSDNTSDTLEVCGNSLDDDCDGAIDAADAECAVPDAPGGLRVQ
ncbi:hypothetical protein ABI59_16320 [Acidobacteria bacterium Mor1]|nr:hypothetical protein ABI59_16320 [Acidobacteria bacterium Mor1]